MKLANAKFAFVFVEKTIPSVFETTPGNSPWQSLLSILEPELKPGGKATKIAEVAWSIELNDGLHILAAILHHAKESGLSAHVLFSKKPLEWLSILAPAPRSATSP
jgi:hypothetical protein